MKNIKRIGALVLALVLVLSLGITAFAAETEIPSGDGTTMPGIGDNPINRDNDEFDAVEPTVKINKSIVFVNSETTNVYEPNITYTYTISKATGTGLGTATTVTDEHDSGSHKVIVYNDYTLSSVVTGSTTATTSVVAFNDGNALVEATANGYEFKKPITFTFTPGNFTHAGVYRFKIVETVTSGTRALAGIENTNYSDTRYLDVYVRNNGSGSYEIYGYVLFESATEDASITSTTTKSNGWVNKSTTAGTQDDVDVYTTYNAVVSKATEGSLADKTHYFPVNVTLTNTASRTTKIRVEANDKATLGSGKTNWKGNVVDATANPVTYAQAANDYISLDSATAVVLGKVDASTTNCTFKDGGEIRFYGIPAATTITAQETNDTYDIYTASVKVDETTTNIDYRATEKAGDPLADVAWTENAASGALSRTGQAKLHAAENITAKKVIAFTNTLTEISPTGVAFRVAPYVLMLCAGIALVLITRRRENTEEA